MSRIPRDFKKLCFMIRPGKLSQGGGSLALPSASGFKAAMEAVVSRKREHPSNSLGAQSLRAQEYGRRVTRSCVWLTL